MKKDRQNENIEEAAKNAFTGYMVIILSVVCFVLSMVVVTALVRLIVGASTGTSV